METIFAQYKSLPRRNHFSQGFTLIELVTVVVIIGILVSFGMPVYNRAMERARDNEAKTNLMLIMAAEKIYLAENGWYYPPGVIGVDDISAINTNLHLNLNENLWDYKVFANNFGVPICGVWAFRNGGGFNRVYFMADNYPGPLCDPPAECP